MHPLSMKPSSVKYLIINDIGQKVMEISARNDLAHEGSPARHVDSSCEAGNKKSSCQDGNYNVLITSHLT
jgi:hypothetical protein